MNTEKDQAQSYRAQMGYKQTPLSKAIGQNWFNTIERLAEKSGVSSKVIIKALHGERISEHNEKKIYAALKL